MNFLYFADQKNLTDIETGGITPRSGIQEVREAVYFVPKISIDLPGKEHLNNIEIWNLICRKELERDFKNSVAIEFVLPESQYPIYIQTDLNKEKSTKLAELLESDNGHTVQYCSDKEFSSVLRGINNHDFIIEAKFELKSSRGLEKFLELYFMSGASPHSANSFFLWTYRTIPLEDVLEKHRVKNVT